MTKYPINKNSFCFESSGEEMSQLRPEEGNQNEDEGIKNHRGTKPRDFVKRGGLPMRPKTGSKSAVIRYQQGGKDKWISIAGGKGLRGGGNLSLNLGSGSSRKKLCEII